MSLKDRFISIFTAVVLAILLCLIMACQLSNPQKPTKIIEDKNMHKNFDIEKAISQYVPTKIEYDYSYLNEKEKKIIKILVEAAKDVDEIFLRQVFDKNIDIRTQLEKKKDPIHRKILHYFKINFGPFDRLNENKCFYGNYVKPKGANFYPEDMTAEEFNKWIDDHPEDEVKFKNPYTVVRRKDGKLVAIPYSIEYAKFLNDMSKKLKEAATLTDNESLKAYLNQRAEDLLKDDYYKSDLLWMDVKDTPIEVVIGPYEVYEDALFGYKTSFEAFITIKDPKMSKKLEKYGKYLVDMEKNLPIKDKYKNFNRGTSSPISVVDEVFVAGDARAGVQTSAFNLPNDERVREAKGSKKVLLRNVMRAKFEKSLKPISEKVLAENIKGYLDFESYFNEVLFHEISHGLGPGKIVKDGKETTVNEQLRDLYPPIEECKADITGLWNVLFMNKKGELHIDEKKLFTTYLAGIFRSVRFGINEAHGKGMIVQYNYLKDKGCIIYDSNSKKYSVDFSKMKEGVKSLTHDILMLEANGDYEAARKFLDKYGYMPDEVEETLSTLKDIPIDIEPIFYYKGSLLSGE